MCDERTLQDTLNHLSEKGISRRRFGQITATASLLAMLPTVANAQDTVESEVVVETPDGSADCYFVHPASGQHPGVLIWPDILGLRDVFRAMGKRLAEAGYSVLVVNPFYRDAEAPVVPEGASFGEPGVRETVFGLAGTLSAETHMTDARAFIGWLDEQEAVDSNRQMGTMGYCMGGPMIMRTAATVPERIGAAASFHGGGLATDADDSPHLLIPQMDANLLIAIAANDDDNEPEAKDILREAFDEAGVEAEIEVYEDTLHGWCVPGSDAYHQASAERAWDRLMNLFDTSLA